MKRSLLIGISFAVALALVPAAKADSFWFGLGGSAITDISNPNCCAPSITGSGFLTGVPDANNPGAFDITGSSGVTFTFNWGSSSPASPSLVGTYNANIYLTGETAPDYSVMYYPPGSTSSAYIYPYDDILTPGSTQLVDTNGLLFELSGTGYEAAISIFSGTAENPGTPCTSSADCVYWWSEYSTSPASEADPYDGIPNAINNAGLGDPLDYFYTPEPSSLFLFGTGILGLAFFLYRRKLIGQHKTV